MVDIAGSAVAFEKGQASFVAHRVMCESYSCVCVFEIVGRLSVVLGVSF